MRFMLHMRCLHACESGASAAAASATCGSTTIFAGTERTCEFRTCKIRRRIIIIFASQRSLCIAAAVCELVSLCEPAHTQTVHTIGVSTVHYNCECVPVMCVPCLLCAIRSYRFKVCAFCTVGVNVSVRTGTGIFAAASCTAAAR